MYSDGQLIQPAFVTRLSHHAGQAVGLLLSGLSMESAFLVQRTELMGLRPDPLIGFQRYFGRLESKHTTALRGAGSAPS